MTVNNAIEYIDRYITNVVDEYKLTKESKDDAGEYIPHLLEAKTAEDKLISLDFGLKDAALNTIPLTLLESNGSTATEFKKISTEEFVRLPQTPIQGATLDIDESLAFAVIYKSLSFLYKGFVSYASDADGLYAGHNDVTRDYLMQRDSVTVEAKIIYFRFSVDGTEWHDSFIDGDYYISFKQGDGVWSSAIKFVGGDGDGSGVATFLELTDTPDTLTAKKFLAVNDAGDAIVEVDAPASSDMLDFTGADDVSGELIVDWRITAPNNNYHYFVLNGDATVDISKTDDEYDLEMGRTYTLEINPEGYDCTISFEARGNKTIDSTSYATIIQFVYDGADIYILNNVVYPN